MCFRLVSTKKKLLGVVLALIIIASVGTSTWMALPKNSLLIGRAYVNTPLVGATITIYDLAGNRLYEAANATLSSGVYVQNVAWTWLWGVPSEFKVTATGGIVNNDPFNGTLVRYVKNYDQKGYYAINTITTLIAAYKDTNSSASYSQAETAVQAFLEIPSGVGITTVINNVDQSRTLFDSAAFTTEANVNGGFDAYVDNLAAQVGQGQTHPFKGPPLVGSVAGDLFEFFGNGIVGGLGGWVVGKVADEALGWVMGLMGFKSEADKTAEQTAAQLAAISTSINQMSAKLDQMNVKLDNIMYDISQISSQIIELKNALNTVDINLQNRISQQGTYDPLSKIDASYATLRSYSKCLPGQISDQTINDWTAAVLSPTTGIPNSVDNINKFITGHVLGDEKGLLEIMVDSLIDQLYKQDPTGATLYGRAYRNKVLNLYKGFEGYFERLLLNEMRGLTLIAEGHHARNETAPVKNYIESTWQPMIKNQINLFVTQVERLVINAEIKSQLEFPNMGPIPASHNATMQAFWQNTYHTAMPNVAEILPLADHFADVKLNGTGRFTTRVLILSDTGENITDPKPVFKNIQTGALITPVGIQKTVYVKQSPLPYYYFTYDLGTQPVGNYTLVSPTAVNSNAPYTGWQAQDITERGEWWSYLTGLKLSTRLSLSPINDATLTHITVSNDLKGNPYGYWGGIWCVAPP